MSVAVLTSYEFSVLGGAERLILDLARALSAEVVVPRFNEDIVSHYDPGREISLRSLDCPLPNEPARQVAGMRLFKRAALDYDFYICIDDISARYLVHPVPHLYYMLTPRRALYDMYYQFLAQKSVPKRLMYIPSLALARAADRRFVEKHVKNLACISHTVRNRIQKIYLRDASVLYPPVHTDRFTWKPSEGYWLSLGRVDKWKRVHLQVEAFSQMPEKTLVVAGQVYPGYEDLKRDAPPNVTFYHARSEEEMIDLYSRCEGFITTAIDEDFGITPVEAMASGKPVVAVREGGYQETVVDGVCGRLVAPEPLAIQRAVREIGRNPDAFRDECHKRAAFFDFREFASQAKNLVSHYSE